jgi:hypothetical protein
MCIWLRRLSAANESHAWAEAGPLLAAVFDGPRPFGPGESGMVRAHLGKHLIAARIAPRRWQHVRPHVDAKPEASCLVLVPVPGLW